MSAPLRVVIMGDSNATSFPGSWAESLEQTPGLQVETLSRPGFPIVLGHAQSLKLTEAERRADVVVLAYGTVDVQEPWYHPRITTAPEYLGNLCCIINQFYHAHAVIACPQLAPKQEPLHPFLISYANAIRKVARRWNSGGSSVRDVSIGAWHDTVRPEHFPPDDVHYNADGHRLMADEIRREVLG